MKPFCDNSKLGYAYMTLLLRYLLKFGISNLLVYLIYIEPRL